MAHQTHNIPWTILASTLKLKRTNPCQHDAQNLHVRRAPDQGKKLTYFTNALVRNAVDHARCDREKYSKQFVSPSDDTIVLADDIARKIEATVYRWRLDHQSASELGPVEMPHGNGLCPHKEKTAACKCPLPFKERQMCAFRRRYTESPCWMFFECNDDGFFNIEVMKTLILYGELDIILPLCADPRVDLKSWWEVSVCGCVEPDVGWDAICRLALEAYIVLNVMHCFQSTWDDDGSSIEYGCIKVYQQIVRNCTTSGWSASDIATYPHRQFFGIQKGQFTTNYPEPYDKARWGHLRSARCSTLQYYPYGLMSFNEFRAFEKPFEYQACANDVSHVRWALCQKGLPVELSNCILEMASYTAQRRLPFPEEPLHPVNRHELDKYLKYCWQLIVRCTTIGQALGMDMEHLLDNMVKKCIQNLFGCACAKLCEEISDRQEETHGEGNNDGERTIRGRLVFKK
ncbi:hypothetical protein B0J13DRAFT_574014 [Dactylonectria estremocensis]|uniref:Uncharacterized protein n=1 Tax=Dactylonectria estremocensis TaxID=1079267 RepID=A0A9P9D7P0_9HYPO|nr:hypothetical protein B0J13DRAFT_574014 [Dactylonectria estremocensis]